MIEIKLLKNFRIDLADVVEVRKGFSTDTFNEVQKMTKTTSKKNKFLNPENCLSIIFDHRSKGKLESGYTLDLRLETSGLMLLINF